MLRARGVDSLYLFGSHARDQAKPSSDIDLFIDRSPGARLSLVGLIGIELDLADLLAAKVDLGTRIGLHPSIRVDVERAAIKVF